MRGDDVWCWWRCFSRSVGMEAAGKGGMPKLREARPFSFPLFPRPCPSLELRSSQGEARGCRTKADTDARIGERPRRRGSAERSAAGAKRRSTESRPKAPSRKSSSPGSPSILNPCSLSHVPCSSFLIRNQISESLVNSWSFANSSAVKSLHRPGSRSRCMCMIRTRRSLTTS